MTRRDSGDARPRISGRTRLLVAAGALLTAGAAPPLPPSLAWGPLFDAVQRARIFADSKAFADAVPLTTPALLRADYARARPRTPEALRAFVRTHFTLPPAPAEAAAGARTPLDAHIAALWPELARPADPVEPGSSRLALRLAYVVPGGRFRELYYWDSLFTALGLVADGRPDLVRALTDNFVDLTERYGHVPNGARSYYLSRSQPPVLAELMALVPPTEMAKRRRWLRALRTEHRFWTAGERCAVPGRPCARVVVMPGGAVLGRYFDDRAAPRDEAYAEDIATAAGSPRPAAAVWRDLRAAAESGWDFSTRWLADPQRLATIRTTAVVPVDLNAWLFALERRIALESAALHDPATARAFTARADARAAAVRRWLWVPAEGRFADWDLEAGRPTPVLSAATLMPLFVGLATPAQAAAVATTVHARLLAPGGLRTTTAASGQQWDAPNGWAPLQWIAVAGLDRYGERALADAVACRFLATITATYAETGRLLEKYDVETRRPGGGGEYPTQDGFGWTNGVARAIEVRAADRPCPVAARAAAR